MLLKRLYPIICSWRIQVCCLMPKKKVKRDQILDSAQDEKPFNKIEPVINESKDILEGKGIKPFTQKQLIQRAKKANQDYLSGNYKTQDQLEQESENW